MSYCEKCGINNACERTDLVDKPVLCAGCLNFLVIVTVISVLMDI